MEGAAWQTVSARDLVGPSVPQEDLGFRCARDIMSGTLVDAMRDGQEYKWVRIGYQIWMAENLNFALTGSRCYDDDESNCDIYGRLYNWTQMLDGDAPYDIAPQAPVQGICPDGWHLPSEEEWYTLVTYTTENADANYDYNDTRPLRATDGWETSGGFVGTDEFGFTALASGYYSTHFSIDGYTQQGESTEFWTSRVHPNYPDVYASVGVIQYNDPDYVFTPYLQKAYPSLPVRCMMDI